MTTIPSKPSASSAIEWIRTRLASLRGQLRRWVMVMGICQWLWWILGILAIDMVIDRLFKMDLAQRGIVLVLIIAAAGYLLYRKLLRPLSRSISDDGLLHEVERRNRELDQSLISSYQLAQLKDLESRGISAELVSATIETGMSRAHSVDFSKVFDVQQNQRNLVFLLLAAVVSAGLFAGTLTNDFLRTWSRRNLLLSNDTWPQATYLEVVGAVNGKIIVPRGTDYRQLVRVTDNSSVTNVEVTLEADAGGNRTLQKMRPTGKDSGREHAFVFHSIATQYRIRASGGDATTEWVELELIEPPAVLEMELIEKLPEYTGHEQNSFTGSGPHKILKGSRLQVIASTNKPVQACRLKLYDAVVATMQVSDDSRTRFETTLEPELGNLLGGKYIFELLDDSELGNIREFHFVVRVSEDKSPVVRARTLGISGLVTPRALVPVEYSVEDDYGITRLGFETSWVSEESGEKSELSFPVTTWPSKPPLAATEDVAVLEIERLKLSPGSSLRLLIVADDNQVPDAAQGRSREFLLRVVSDEELRADLLRREIEQRKSFQQTYDAQMSLIAEVRQVAAIPNEASNLAQANERMQNALVSLFRMQRGIGTSADLVAKRFEEFLVEVQNNRLDEETAKIDPERTIQARFEQEIIRPIRWMDGELVTAAARSIDACRRNLDDVQRFGQSIDETVEIQEQILEQMRQILAAMESSETFQEMVNRLLEIKRIEESLRKQLDSKGDLKGIFDDKSDQP